MTGATSDGRHPTEEYAVPAPTAAARPPGAGGPAAQARTFAAPMVLALLIAALGLLVAASTSLTTSAAAIGASARGGSEPRRPARALTGEAPHSARAVKAALVREVAAQRSEQLARESEAAGRSARDAAGFARQDRLTRSERSSEATAARIAAQRLARAEAARRAAEERVAQLAAAQADASASRTDPADDSAPNPSPTDPSTTDPAGLGAGTAGAGLPAGVGVLPVPSGVIGAVFGARGHWSSYHTGLDFRARYGTPIRAVLPGVVLFAGNSGDWAGNHVAVRHAGGQTTMYSHMASITARPGQRVRAGEVIGYVGQTGRAFGAHLHFELYPAGVRYGDVYRAVDPGPWLRAVGVRTQ